jgi:hypothetical protein
MRLVLVLALLLAGCGFVDPYTRSRAPEADGTAVRNGVAAVFKEAKLSGTPMVSRIYEANLVSRGDWLMCLRGSSSPKGDTYTLYFTGGNLVATQRSVLVDRCEDQAYAPYTLTPVIASPQPGSPQAVSPQITSSTNRVAPTPISAPQGTAAQVTPGSSRIGEPMVLTPR